MNKQPKHCKNCKHFSLRKLRLYGNYVSPYHCVLLRHGIFDRNIKIDSISLFKGKPCRHYDEKMRWWL